jgi:hypothetical protein
MPELLKNMFFTTSSVNKFGDTIKQFYPDFDKEKFVNLVFDGNFENKELKNDESEFVRRSVANNLNDISKDHADLVLNICERWYGHSENTDKIVKHACRGMLKAGNKRALRYVNPKTLFRHSSNFNNY